MGPRRIFKATVLYRKGPEGNKRAPLRKSPGARFLSGPATKKLIFWLFYLFFSVETTWLRSSFDCQCGKSRKMRKKWVLPGRIGQFPALLVNWSGWDYCTIWKMSKHPRRMTIDHRELEKKHFYKRKNRETVPKKARYHAWGMLLLLQISAPAALITANATRTKKRTMIR